MGWSVDDKDEDKRSASDRISDEFSPSAVRALKKQGHASHHLMHEAMAEVLAEMVTPEGEKGIEQHDAPYSGVAHTLLQVIEVMHDEDYEDNKDKAYKVLMKYLRKVMESKEVAETIEVLKDETN